MKVKTDNFFDTNLVFTLAEFTEHLLSRKSENINTRKALLRYYKKQGRIKVLSKGLYATVPNGFDSESFSPDPYLIASKLKPDAVLAYHTALELHGCAYSVFNEYQYISRRPSLKKSQFGYFFKGVWAPEYLLEDSEPDNEITILEYRGQRLRITSLERTLVDVLDRPLVGGGWEEIWRSAEAVDFFALDKVVAYAKRLGNATTSAKLGFFLEQHKAHWQIPDHYIETLQADRPKSPHYLDRKVESQFSETWNLMIPVSLINRTWESVL